MGCYWHGCKSCFTDDRDTTPESRSFTERRKATADVSKNITDAGYNLVVMWECEWRSFVKETPMPDNQYHYPGEEKYRLTEHEILDMVRDGSMFGAIEVDIQVPTNLRDKFSEMTPIFKNAEVTEDHIGTYMREFLAASEQKFQNTKYLIGSVFGNKILLITPLLKWYLEHGLVVTKVHQLVQFQPKRCFKRFADQVSNDRRAGKSRHMHLLCFCLTFQFWIC